MDVDINAGYRKVRNKRWREGGTNVETKAGGDSQMLDRGRYECVDTKCQKGGRHDVETNAGGKVRTYGCRHIYQRQKGMGVRRKNAGEMIDQMLGGGVVMQGLTANAGGRGGYARVNSKCWGEGGYARVNSKCWGEGWLCKG